MTIDENLEKVIKSLQTSCEEAAKGTVGEELRPWFNFSDVMEVGQFELDKLRDLFVRDAANAEYLVARSTAEAKTKAICVPKMTVDMLGGMQRDYAMRMRSRIRIFCHSAAMHSADSEGTGPLRRNSIDLLTRIAGGDYLYE
jgi:hypothetical protein